MRMEETNLSKWWKKRDEIFQKKSIAQKQHGIIKCDRNVWNVLHV